MRYKIHSLEERITNEFGYNRALDQVLFEELIKCMNYHAGGLDEKGMSEQNSRRNNLKQSKNH